jgi:hypothetical protein
MTSSPKTTILVLLVGMSVCLSAVLARAKAAPPPQTAPQGSTWIAADAARAVGTLLDTGTFTYLDHAVVPGTLGVAPADVKFKALRSKAAGIKISARDGSAYLASRPDAKVPYETKNAWPKIAWKPKTKNGVPAVQLKGENGTKFAKLGGTEKVRSKTVLDSVRIERGTEKADKFAVSLKSEGQTGKMAVTKPQLRAFKERIKSAKKDRKGSAQAVFAGSLDDEPAVFVPIVRVRGGKATDFKITATPVR